MMVRLLGSVEVVDREEQPAKFERSKTLELVTWLVTHRARASRSAARTALWELDVRDATFANVVSEARRAMARHVPPPAGDEWLRRTMTDELSLHDEVIADADVVRRRFERARADRRNRGDGAAATGGRAGQRVALHRHGYLWPDAEGITSNLVLLATNVTAEYAKLALAAGDVDGVFWATGRGLRVLAGQEALIALRMRAHADAGDLSGVRLEWEAYERVDQRRPVERRRAGSQVGRLAQGVTRPLRPSGHFAQLGRVRRSGLNRRASSVHAAAVGVLVGVAGLGWWAGGFGRSGGGVDGVVVAVGEGQSVG